MSRSFLCLRVVSAFVAALLLQACSSRPVAPSIQDGVPFPSVVGEALDKRTVRIPEDFAGTPTVLLIGYTQRAQFDIDRWILGLLQLKSPARIVEIPTIAGMAPTILQDVINNGMRSGIPEEDWGSVVTVFGDAEKIVNAIGNERPQSAHVVLLDSAGKIVTKMASGYSATNVGRLDEQVRGLTSSAAR